MILTGCKVDEVLKELFVSSEIIAVNTTESTLSVDIAHGVVLSDILDTLPPCSVTPIDSLDNYSFSSELNVTLDENTFNMGPFIFDSSLLSHKSEVSLDIVIYPDYSLQLIPILSVASEYAISHTPSTTDDSDSDWDWD